MAKTKLVINGPPGTEEVLIESGGVTLGRDSGCEDHGDQVQSQH
ncbi:hypothetical protein ACFL6U_18935 [Planctomycetota bacterium]